MFAPRMFSNGDLFAFCMALARQACVSSGVRGVYFSCIITDPGRMGHCRRRYECFAQGMMDVYMVKMGGRGGLERGREKESPISCYLKSVIVHEFLVIVDDPRSSDVL